MKKISDEHIFYEWSETNPPVMVIQPGERVEFETMDCLSNVLKHPDDDLKKTSFDKDKVNPATGPVYIEGAQPGDVLQVTIEEIRFKEQAVITCQAGYGVIGKYFDETTFKITKIKDGKLQFDEITQLTLDPMLGVLGTTPKGEKVPTGMLGSFGGNMDNTMMRPGAVLYLPVYVEGALAAVGDVHALMGDGEINCSALEAAAFVTLKFDLRKDLKIENPVLINGKDVSTVASHPSLDKAVDQCVEEMALLLKERLDLPFDAISMLMSSVGQAEICQVVSPLKTARYRMPLPVLETYGFKF